MSDKAAQGKVLLEIRNMTKAYGDHIVLENINIDVHQGEVIAIDRKSVV